MNKTEFVNYIAERNEISKKAANDMVDTVFAAVRNVLADGNDLRTPIGTYKVKTVSEREYTVMLGEHKGERAVSPEHKKVSFVASEQLKEAINA